MSGIEYIKIIDNKNKDWRFSLAEKCQPFVEPILRDLFKDKGMELMDGTNIIECKKSDLKGRYDLIEGIDMILRFKDKTKGTLQQKILFSDFKTITFEEIKNSGKPGAWYYCTSQYYFIVYTNESEKELRQLSESYNFKCTIRDARLLNLATIHQLSLNNKIKWSFNTNSRDGRRSDFRYIFYNNIPDSCLIAKYPFDNTLFDNA